MLTDPYFWLYGTFFFFSAGILRLTLHLVKKKKGVAVLVPFLFSLSFLAVFWIVSSDFTFSSVRNGIIFCLSAVLPGVLAGIHPVALILPPAAVFILALTLDVPTVPLVRQEKTPLATLTLYPATEGQVFYEWTPAGSKPVLGSLSGSQIAAVVRKEILPEYLFFLKSPWSVAGLLTENLAVSQLPDADSDTFVSFPAYSKGVSAFSRYEFPALQFLDPGYFNSYSFSIRNNDELLILERK